MSVAGDPSLQDDPRVIRALEEYLAAMEAGQPIAREELLARHPGIDLVLSKCLDGLEFVHATAADVGAGWDESASPTNQALGDFRLLRELGRGGMGVVYEAQQLSLNRRVALKVLPFAAVLDPRALQRFKNEAQAAAALDHPHIVDVYAVGCERGVHYYAMRLIEGQTLADVIEEMRSPQRESRGQSDSPLSFAGEGLGVRGSTVARAHDSTVPSAFRVPHSAFPTVAQLGIDVAEALDHAHEQGVIHRDIKPSNLMLDVRGKAWVTDFGLARIGNDVQMTRTGDLLGTLRYMSPEQTLGERTLDHRTDIYSLGATLYELLTREPLFAGAERGDLLRQIAESDPRPLRQIDSRIPADLETIVLKCLEKEPQDRYATARELAADLRRFLSHQPVLASRPTLGQRTNKWIRRHAAGVKAAAAALVFAVLGLAVATLFVWDAKREVEAAFEQSGRDKAVADAERQRAQQEELNQRQHRYAAEMALAHQAWLRGDLTTTHTLLAGHIPEKQQADLRGFEWHYLVGLLHSKHAVKEHAVASCGHAITSLAFAPHQATIAITGPSAQIKLFGSGGEHEKFAGILDGHQSNVNQVVYCDEYKLLCSASDDGTIRLWRAADKQPAGVLEGHAGPVLCLYVSHDGKHLVSGGADGTIRAWNLASRQMVRQWRGHDRPVHRVALTYDYVPLSSDDSEFVRRWNWDHPEPQLTLTSAADVLALACSPTSPLLATGDRDGIVRLWNSHTGDERATLGRHPSPIQDLHFSHDGELLASCSADGTVSIWNPHRGEMLQRYVAHSAGVTSVRFAHVSDGLFTSSADGTFKIWHIQSRPDSRWIGDGGRDIVDIGFSAHGHALAALHGHNPSVTGSKLPIKASPDEVYHLLEPFRSIVFLPDRKQFAAAFESGQVEMLSLETETGATLARETGVLPVRLEASPDGRWLADWSIDGSVRLWSVDRRQSWHWPATPQAYHTGLAFSSDSRVLAVAAGQGGLKFWLLDEARWDDERWQAAWARQVAWSPVDNTLAVASADQDLHLFDYGAGRWFAALKSHTKRPRCLAFSPDGRTLASGSENEVHLWHVVSRQSMIVLRPQTPGIIRAVRFSADNQALAAIVHPFTRTELARPGGVCLWLTQQPPASATPQPAYGSGIRN